MNSKVYFIALSDNPTIEQQVDAVRRLSEACHISDIFEANDMVAIKLSVGEKNNTTHIKPPLAKEIVTLVKKKKAYPFLTETSTLYKGERQNAVKHILHAAKHGFGMDEVGAPFIMADGLLGDSEMEVEINGELFRSVKIAREAVVADAMIVLTHPTGHMATGLGAAIKNVGMGLASRMGKMRQHSAAKPEIIPNKCRFCGKCLEWCPEGVILEKEGKAYINTEHCIGCGQCLAVCHFDSVKYDWNAKPEYLQKAMAEHAYGSVKNKLHKTYYINVLVDMTKDCDCAGKRQEKLIPDVGILASTDAVAIDVATLDLTKAANGKHLTAIAHPKLDPFIQLRHAEKLGLGSTTYELITL